MKNLVFWMILITPILQGCMADLRTELIKSQGISKVNEDKGKKILEEAWKIQGFDKLNRFESYSFHGVDNWKGIMGKIGTPWPETKSDLLFKFEVGTFDSQVKFLNGKKTNVVAGLQSWNYYEFADGEQVKKLNMNKRIRFGLSAYQYFFELLDRLKRAPLISWAGEEKFGGENYDVVFVTWQKPEPHMEHDQYKLWINQKTKLLDYAIYTLRENFLKMPGGRAFYGSIKYTDYRAVEGVLIPHTQSVFLNRPKKKENKNLHQLKVSDFQFNNFDLKLLKPFPEVNSTGDSKEKG